MDLDQFVVAVELLGHPDLRGRPVVVGDAGDLTRRGVVAGASYEARQFGIHSAMPLRRAAARCPDLVCLPLDVERYQAASVEVMAALRSLPGAVVEVAGWDEAFLDIQAADPEHFARVLQATVRARTGLSCSVGIGDNKLQAKTATELAKPGGVRRLSTVSWPARIWPRPPDELPGIGSKTARRLAEHDIRTVGELAAADGALLASVFGPVAGPRLRSLARGQDRSPVSPVPRPARSHGQATIFQHDVEDPTAVHAAVQELAAQVASGVAAQGRNTVRLVVTVRFAPFDTHAHGTSLALDAGPGAFERAAEVALGRFVLDRPVRLVGVRAELDRGEVELARRTEPRDLGRLSRT